MHTGQVILGVGEAVGITFAVSVISSVAVGFLLGLLVMYLIMRSRMNKYSVSTGEQQTAPTVPGPVYEEVSPQTDKDKEVIELETNLAYGPVRH